MNLNFHPSMMDSVFDPFCLPKEKFFISSSSLMKYSIRLFRRQLSIVIANEQSIFFLLTVFWCVMFLMFEFNDDNDDDDGERKEYVIHFKTILSSS